MNLADSTVPTCAPVVETKLSTYQRLYDFTLPHDANAESYRTATDLYTVPIPDHFRGGQKKVKDP